MVSHFQSKAKKKNKLQFSHNKGQRRYRWRLLQHAKLQRFNILQILIIKEEQLIQKNRGADPDRKHGQLLPEAEVSSSRAQIVSQQLMRISNQAYSPRPSLTKLKTNNVAS